MAAHGRVSRAGLPRGRGLHGSRQLGDLARRRLKYGYALLSVALISNIIAVVLQALCARLAIATGRDSPRPAVVPIRGR